MTIYFLFYLFIPFTQFSCFNAVITLRSSLSDTIESIMLSHSWVQESCHVKPLHWIESLWETCVSYVTNLSLSLLFLDGWKYSIFLHLKPKDWLYCHFSIFLCTCFTVSFSNCSVPYSGHFFLLAEQSCSFNTLALLIHWVTQRKSLIQHLTIDVFVLFHKPIYKINIIGNVRKLWAWSINS